MAVAFPLSVMANKELLIDTADILTASEEDTLREKLTEISGKFSVDIAVVTVNGTDGKSATSYINSYFDNSDLGYGSSRDAVLFLIDMDAREFRILSNGDIGAAAVSESDIDSITDMVTSDLSNGNYFSAFNSFADECEYQINGQINGFPFQTGRNLIICVVIGLVAAFIVTGNMKGKLKTVKKKDEAASYLKQGSLSVTESKDVFLYSRVTQTRREKEESSSSSGSSRNVGGGSF